MKKALLLFSFAGFLLLLPSCKKDGGLNLFSIEDDKALGLQTTQQILSDSSGMDILDSAAYPAVYQYLYQMRNEILSKGNLQYREEFDWKLYVIHDDSTLNAFCTPGGYIFVYTGLIKYLESASALAGVMGHEMAHADRRHSTNQLTKAYGIETLLSFLLGGTSQQLASITASLIELKFSRNDETEADRYSVEYLCPTRYRASGAADFFTKIEQSGGSSIPQFLSTHPNPDNRIQAIEAHSAEKGCTAGISIQEDQNDYQLFKNRLP